MSSKIVIGVGHYSRTGKDTFANRLVVEFVQRKVRAVKRPFAWKLKQIAHELYGWAGVREPEYYDTPEGELERSTILPALGTSVVDTWIYLGNAIRNQVYAETWIQTVLRGNESGVVVIPDVRFPNEVDSIRAMGGFLIKVIRPGFPPRDSVSDRTLLGYEDWDLVIGQSGDIRELYEAAETVARSVVETGQFPTQALEARRSALRIERQTLQDAGIPA